MKLPWLKTKEATVPELEQQLQAAEQAHDAARGDVEAIVVEFDEHPTPATEKKLTAANEHERLMEMHVQRARRLLAQAREREARERREALCCERDRIAASLSSEHLAAERAPGIEAEIAAIENLVRVRVQRIETERAIDRREIELNHVKRQLGEETKRHPFGPTIAGNTEVQKALSQHRRDEFESRLIYRILEALKG